MANTSTRSRDHRPAHHQLALRRAGEHWNYDRETRLFTREPGRRPAGYVRASDASKSFDDPGVFVELPLVNQIRPRVDAWREAGYPGATGITKRLLKHWRDPEQREAVAASSSASWRPSRR